MAITKAALDEIKLAYQEATAELAALKIRQKQEQVPLIIRTQSLRMRLRRAMAGQEQNHLDYVEAKLTYDAEQSARHAPVSVPAPVAAPVAHPFEMPIDNSPLPSAEFFANMRKPKP